MRYAIPATVGARASTGAAFTPITEVSSDTDKVLQWVAYDGDSFEVSTSNTDRRPGWSGFCDVNAYIPGSTALPTPGSNLGLAGGIIGNLSGGTKTLADAVIYFRNENGTSIGISGGSGESITLDTAIPSGGRINERYKLAWSSYALEVDGNDDLILHYNFSPIRAAGINGSSSVLLKNVTNFRFKGSEGSLRIKICKEEKIGAGANATVHACKEKVVF